MRKVNHESAKLSSLFSVSFVHSAKCTLPASVGRRAAIRSSDVGKVVGMADIVGHFVAFRDEIHEAVGRGGRRDVAQRAHADRARRDLKRRADRQDHAPAEAGLRKFLRHARNAEADPRQRNEQVVRAELDLRLQADAVLLEILLNIGAGARLALEQDEREGRDLLERVGVVKITVVIRRCRPAPRADSRGPSGSCR